MSYPLPDPCPVDGRPVMYRGRGRRPDYCSPECRARAAAASRPERRAHPMSAADLAEARFEDVAIEWEQREEAMAVLIASGSMIPRQRGGWARGRPHGYAPTGEVELWSMPVPVPRDARPLLEYTPPRSVTTERSTLEGQGPPMPPEIRRFLVTMTELRSPAAADDGKVPAVGALDDDQRAERAIRDYEESYDRAVRVYALRSIPRPRRRPVHLARSYRFGSTLYTPAPTP